MTMATDEYREIAPYKLQRIRQLIDERIYFIKCENFIRITRSSSDPKYMLRGMQPHCPFDMVIITSVPGGQKLQMALEKAFSRYQHNSLWFRYEGELKEWLDEQNRMDA